MESSSIPEETTTPPPARFNFQHFDQESDFGIENENGERVRKRKRPGRKPNPPSIQERRAQNRAAQRAFREREQQRRQEKERESQRHVEELAYLRRRLAEVQYEANYLRGCVLLLSLTSLVERGSVPHIWTDTRLFPLPWADTPPPQPVDDIHTVPAILNTVLGKDSNILQFQEALVAARCTGWELPDQIAEVLNNFEQHAPSNDDDTATPTEPAISLSLSSHPPNVPPPPPPTSSSSSSSSTPPRPPSSSSSSSSPSTNEPRKQNPQDESIQDLPVPSAGPESMVSSFTATNPVVGTVHNSPTLKTPSDLAHMPSLQALHILRLQLKCSSILGDKTRFAFTPTALQRLIPHDVRIDYIPLASLRDRMILFQGLYDADECFELLSTKTMFIGGEERDSRNWVLHPSFSEKYWFLSHQLVDHHSGECGLIPEIIETILAAQRQKEEKLKKLKEQNVEKEGGDEQSSSHTTMPANSDNSEPLPSITREGGYRLRSPSIFKIHNIS